MVTYIFFKLNDERDRLEIQDSIIDSEEELINYIIGTGFASITDIQTGPDGEVYIDSLENGSIYKISYFFSKLNIYYIDYH